MFLSFIFFHPFPLLSSPTAVKTHYHPATHWGLLHYLRHYRLLFSVHCVPQFAPSLHVQPLSCHVLDVSPRPTTTTTITITIIAHRLATSWKKEERRKGKHHWQTGRLLLLQSPQWTDISGQSVSRGSIFSWWWPPLLLKQKKQQQQWRSSISINRRRSF